MCGGVPIGAWISVATFHCRTSPTCVSGGLACPHVCPHGVWYCRKSTDLRIYVSMAAAASDYDVAGIHALEMRRVCNNSKAGINSTAGAVEISQKFNKSLTFN